MSYLRKSKSTQHACPRTRESVDDRSLPDLERQWDMVKKRTCCVPQAQLDLLSSNIEDFDVVFENCC